MSGESSNLQGTDPLGPSNWLAVAVLAITVGLVYGSAFDAPFNFDDKAAIVNNSSIVALWHPIGTADHPGPLNPARDLPTAARPLVNLSFALNHRFGGLNPIGYHFVNILIHLLNAVLLWLIIRRTFRLPYFNGQFDTAAGWIALAAALLWALHPLQTETVIYTTQRTELMMAFFYFATLYCGLRYWASNHLLSQRAVWLTLAVFACLAGMASKEVMVSAPLIVFLFERSFIAGSTANTFRRSWPLYVGLCSTWLLLLALNISGPRAASAGFHLGVAPHVWWLTQCQAILMYLKLALWPSPLLIHYELPYLKTFADAWMYVIPVLLLAVVAITLLWRNKPAGFLLAFIAAILAPTSVVPVVTEMAAERRMYLPLAALLTPLVIAIFYFAHPTAKRTSSASKTRPDSNSTRYAFLLSIPVLALIYGVASAKRLGDYYDETLMWQQVVQAQPNNHVAHYNLGLMYNYAGREDESMAELQAAVAANPDYPNVRSALGFALITAGRLPEAVESLEAALAIKPDYVPALNNMGIALTNMSRYPEAIEYLKHAIRLDPGHIPAHINLGKALMGAGRTADAIKALQAAESLAADDPDMLYDLATVLAANNQSSRAIELLERAVQLRPDFAAAHNRLGIALAQSGNASRAMVHFLRLMQLNPSDPSAYFNSANAAVAQGDFNQAAPLYAEAVRLRPDSPEARLSLANALGHTGRPHEAIEQLRIALHLNPELLSAYASLADMLARTHRTDEAIQVCRQGIEAANASGDKKVADQLQELNSRLQPRAKSQ